MDFEIYKFKLLHIIKRKSLKIMKTALKFLSVLFVVFTFHSFVFYGRSLLFNLNELENIFTSFSRFNFLSFPIFNLALIILSSLFLLMIQINFIGREIKNFFSVSPFLNKLKFKIIYPNFICSCFSSNKTCQLLN